MLIADYICDKCAACCCYLSVPVNEDDITREPLVGHATHRVSLPLAPEIATVGYLNHPTREDGDSCKLLDDNGNCTVQATKPFACDKFLPGSTLCQWARGRAGLGPLRCETYGYVF